MTDLPSAQPYSIEFTATARRSLHRLPSKIVGACVELIAAPLAHNPARLGKPLVRELLGHRSARRGSYRVIYRIDDKRASSISCEWNIEEMFIVRLAEASIGE